MLFFFFIQLILSVISIGLASYGVEGSLLPIGIIAMGLYGVMAFFEARRERWGLSPLVAYLGVSVLYVGVAPVWAWACNILGYEDIHKMGFLTLTNDLPMAQGFGLLGVSCFYFGYKLTHTSALMRWSAFVGSRSPDLRMSVRVWVIVMLIAWLLRISHWVGLPVGKIGSLFGYIAFFTSSGAFLIMISNIENRGKDLIIKPAGWRIYLALGMAAVDISFNALQTGMRNPILKLMILLLWGYFLQREVLLRSQFSMDRVRGILKPAILFAAAAVLILVFIMPFGKQVAKGEELPESEEISYVAFNLADSFPDQGVWALPKRMATVSMHSLSACIQLREFLPPENTVADMVMVGVIPRLFWPDKPFITRGAAFSVILNVGMGMDEESATTSTAMTAIGELYWSYGILGIIIGMGLIGLLCGFTFNTFSRNFMLHPIRALVVVNMVLYSFMWFGSDATYYFVFTVYIWVVFIPLSLLSFSWFGVKKAS